MAIILYGIPNCDTIKKARRWLDEKGISYSFHDFRKDGLTKKTINNWLTQLDWNDLVNTRGMTWRKLSEDQKENLTKTKAIALMLEYPALIKRPVLDLKDKFHIGFKPEQYKKLKF